MQPATQDSTKSPDDVSPASTPLVWRRITNITQDLPAATKGHLNLKLSTAVTPVAAPAAAFDRQMSGSGPHPSAMDVLAVAGGADAAEGDANEEDPSSPNSDYHHDPEHHLTYNVQPSDLGPRYFRDVAQGGQKSLLVVMVGLPACGKTFLAQKLCRLLSWQGYKAQVYNCQVAWKRKLRAMQQQETSSSKDPTPTGRTDPPTPLSMATPALSGFPSATAEWHVDPSPSPAAVRVVNSADTYRDLYEAPESLARQAYLAVLDELAVAANTFFQNESYSGNVVILNDDFATAELRELAHTTVGATAARVIFVEVQQAANGNEQTALFSELKASDPAEYIPQQQPQQSTGSCATPAEPVVVASPASASPTSAPPGMPVFPAFPGAAQPDASAACSPTSASALLSPSTYSPSATSDATTALTPSFALRDFHHRVAHITRVYEPLTPASQKSYVKLTNASALEIHKVTGFLCSRIVSFLMNLSQNKMQHPIYFVRHGQSMYNLDDRLGGNPELTPKGQLDAEALCGFLAHLKGEEQKRGVANEMQLWTSQLRRAIQTAEPAEKRLQIPCLRWSSLNEIHAGVCENMTYKELEVTYPLIHRFRSENKYSFRYPEGESYQDLVFRLEPIIMELENADRVVVVVAHQAVLRALLAYFGGTPAESAVYVEVPHRCVWRCSYNTAGTSVLDMLKLGAVTAGDGSKD